jgi:hypothetical protein
MFGVSFLHVPVVGTISQNLCLLHDLVGTVFNATNNKLTAGTWDNIRTITNNSKSNHAI